VWQNIVTPSRFFGLNPSRRASFRTSGEGSEEAVVSEPAGFAPVAAESVPATAADSAVAAAEEEAVDEEAAADEDALVAVVPDAGACASHGAAAITMSDARSAKR
jgi:hypothetical protein